MSYHWENTIWESKDGSWNRGYFERISNPYSSDSDYDSEWDDDFNFEAFDYVKTGFKTEAEALQYTPNGNPGSWSTLHYAGNSKKCKYLDQLAFFAKNPAEKAKFERKELLRKNREHFKKLSETWTPESVASASSRYTILTAVIKSDEEAYSQFGLSTHVNGYLKVDGDWFKIEGKRVYNKKTNKFAKNVHRLYKF